MKAHVAESVGTFALVFAGCGAIAVGALSPTGIALAFGIGAAAAGLAYRYLRDD